MFYLEALSGYDVTRLRAPAVGLAAAVGVVTWAALYLLHRLRVPRAPPLAPPTLPSLPLIGSAPFLPWRPAEYAGFFLEKGKRLGSVFGFYSGSQYTVVLNGRDAIHEALVKRSADFADRAPMYAERTAWNVGLHGIISRRYDADFKLNHHLTLSLLKDVGLGNPLALEARIDAELDALLEGLVRAGSRALDPREPLQLATLNVIGGMLLGGARFEAVDDILRNFMKQAAEFLTQLDPALDFVPIARLLLPPYRALVGGMLPLRDAFMGTVRALIQACLGRADEDNFVRGYVTRAGPNYDHAQLDYLVRDLANGGMQTTAIALQWTIILLGNNPVAQERMLRAIDAQVPRERRPCLEDRRRLPYVDAFLLEAQRCRALLPLVFPHAATCNTQVAGFAIPAGTVVIANMHSLHMDPALWPDPHVFRPERFLDSEGELVNKNKVISFSLGKRSCPGEELARQELFLFVAALVQRFAILPPEGKDRIRDEAVTVRFCTPAPFEARFVPRA